MTKIKNIGILGSTGSIGRSSLEVISNFPAEFHIAYLTTNKNIQTLEKQINCFKPKAVAVLDRHSATALQRKVDKSVKIFIGEEGLIELSRNSDVEIVINSLVGFAGLRPTIESIMRGKTIALANKETLVVAGEIITKLLKKHNATIIPVDSEHSAILQCLTGENPKHIARLILTASGGPFLTLDKKKFSRVTVSEALKHPNWKMGSKITIDSATLMNKGLEVIEAHWLFNLPPDKIEVLIHPQSIIHSMVEFIDGSIKAQLGVPDMKIPIQYALTHPNRAVSNYKRIDFDELRTMTFSKPDLEKFECLQLAYDALREGDTAPVILNAANEVAVDLFLNNIISFDRIPHLIAKALETIAIKHKPNLDDIIETDRTTRIVVKNVSKTLKKKVIYAHT